MLGQHLEGLDRAPSGCPFLGQSFLCSGDKLQRPYKAAGPCDLWPQPWILTLLGNAVRPVPAAEPAGSGGSGSWLWRSGAAAPSAGTAPLSGVRVPHQALARKLNYLVSLDSFRVVRFDLLSDFVVYVSLACVFNFSFV